MQFKVYHPSFPDLSFYLPLHTAAVELAINRLGPYKLISGTYDWPKRFGGFRGWTDSINSLWWPRGADNFATLAVVIDDTRNELLEQLIQAQKDAQPDSNTYRWPYIILSAELSQSAEQMNPGPPPVYRVIGDRYEPQNLGPLEPGSSDVPLIEWKLYPLAPINLTSTAGTLDYPGLWLLPLVDIRYFSRNSAPNPSAFSSSDSAADKTSKYPVITIQTDTDQVSWMPPVRGWPQDAGLPINYTPILGIKTSPDIGSATRFGEAADMQASVNNWRVVNRDVRSNYNTNVGNLQHTSFKGLVSDYPEDWNSPSTSQSSYHKDVLDLYDTYIIRISGGHCDPGYMDSLTPRKLQFSFLVEGTQSTYNMTIRTTVDYPEKLADFAVDTDGPDDTEKLITPMVFLPIRASSKYPELPEQIKLYNAAKQWALLYYAWRHKQIFIQFAGIYPLIPNGHAQLIKWNFSGGDMSTTYIAVEGVAPDSQLNHAPERKEFYAVIDGEGSIDFGLQGVYAFTELQDKNGTLTLHPEPVRGFVMDVNDAPYTINPARDLSGKTAVPVGLTVAMRPGTPYLDFNTQQIFDHYLFITTDLLQIVKIHTPPEFNNLGHVSGVVRRYDPETHELVDSEPIWIKLPS